MNIISPRPYREVMTATKFYISDSEIFDLSVLPSNVVGPFNVTRLSEDTLLGTYGESTYRNYIYRSIILTDNDNNIYAVIIRDRLQEVYSRSLTLRVQILLRELPEKEYEANIYSTAQLNINNRYHRPTSRRDIITNFDEASIYNQNQPVYRNVIVSENDTYIDSFLGLRYSKEIRSVIPCYVNGLPTLEITTVYGTDLFKLDTKEYYSTSGNPVSGFSLVGSMTDTNRYGFVEDGRDLLGGVNINLSEGIPFRGVGTDRDLIMINQNSDQYLGLDFDTISRYLDEDCKLTTVKRFLTPKYSLFFSSDYQRILIIDIGTHLVKRYLDTSGSLIIRYTKDDIIVYATDSADEYWNSTEVLNSYVNYEGDLFSTDCILSFFNKNYAIKREGKVISKFI